LQSLVLKRLYLPGLPFLFLGLTLDFIALTFQEWAKVVFYTDFQQALATRIGFLFMLVRLAGLGILYLQPSLDNYSWMLIATSLISMGIWGLAFQWRFRFHPLLNRRAFTTLKDSLKSYGLWDHLNRIALDTLTTIDVVVLSWFAFIQLDTIGSYTIALRFTSLLLLVPIQIHRSLQLVLSNYADAESRSRAIAGFVKINSLISIMQLVFILIAGKWLMRLLFGADVSTDAIYYATIIATGVAILNLSWPFISVINNLCNLSHAFFAVFLPSLASGLVIYIWTAASWGATGIAYGKGVAFALMTLGLVVFATRKHPFSLKLQLITAEEKSILYGLAAKIQRFASNYQQDHKER
jgi:hypothetical protein